MCAHRYALKVWMACLLYVCEYAKIYIYMCNNIFIEMLKDIGIAVPKTRETRAVCHKTKDYGIKQ